MIYWYYFKGIMLLSLGIGILLTVLFGLQWGYLFFVTLAPLSAHLLHGQTRGRERVFYLNQGISPRRLLWHTFLIQLVLSVPVFLILIGFYTFFYGGF